MPTNSLTSLISALGDKVRMLETMRSLLEEEERHITGLRPELLAENTRRTEETVAGLHAVNERLRTLLFRSGSEMGLSETTTLSLLITRVSGEYGAELRAMQEKCFSAAAAIKRHLAVNEGLLKDSLFIIDRSMSLFAGLMGGCETYGAAGRMMGGKITSGIVCREI